MSHTYKFGRTIVRCLTIDIKPHRLEEIRQFSVLPDYAVHIREGVRSALLTRLYREFRLTDRISVLTVEGLILEALGIGARQKSRYTVVGGPTSLAAPGQRFYPRERNGRTKPD